MQNKLLSDYEVKYAEVKVSKQNPEGTAAIETKAIIKASQTPVKHPPSEKPVASSSKSPVVQSSNAEEFKKQILGTQANPKAVPKTKPGTKPPPTAAPKVESGTKPPLKAAPTYTNEPAPKPAPARHVPTAAHQMSTPVTPESEPTLPPPLTSGQKVYNTAKKYTLTRPGPISVSESIAMRSSADWKQAISTRWYPPSLAPECYTEEINTPMSKHSRVKLESPLAIHHRTSVNSPSAPISLQSSDTDSHSIDYCVAICTSTESRFRFHEGSGYPWIRSQVLQRELELSSQAAVEAAVNDSRYLIAYSVVRNFEQLPLDSYRDYAHMWKAAIHSVHKQVYIVVEKIWVSPVFLT